MARKEMRLDFARNHMTWNTEWRYVVFSDEKNLISRGQMDTITISMTYARKNINWIAYIVGRVVLWCGEPSPTTAHVSCNFCQRI